MKIDDFKKEKIEAMKNKDKDAINALNLVITKIMNLTIERRESGAEVNDGDINSILVKCEKELIEEMEGFKAAGRMETVESLNNQIKTVQKYLPKMLSDEEIINIISTLEDKTMPSIMKHFKNNYQGKVDMRKVGEIAKKY